MAEKKKGRITYRIKSKPTESNIKNLSAVEEYAKDPMSVRLRSHMKETQSEENLNDSRMEGRSPTPMESINRSSRSTPKSIRLKKKVKK